MSHYLNFSSFSPVQHCECPCETDLAGILYIQHRLWSVAPCKGEHSGQDLFQLRWSHGASILLFPKPMLCPSFMLAVSVNQVNCNWSKGLEYGREDTSAINVTLPMPIEGRMSRKEDIVCQLLNSYSISKWYIYPQQLFASNPTTYGNKPSAQPLASWLCDMPHTECCSCHLINE